MSLPLGATSSTSATTTSTSRRSSSSRRPRVVERVTPTSAFAVPGTGAYVRLSSTADGDLRPFRADSDELDPLVGARLRRIVDLPWRFVRQVHSNTVVIAEAGASRTERADALVSSSPSLVLAVLGADCPLVGLASPEGVIGVAHAGWRGLLAGVLPATVAAMRDLGATRCTAVLGACIHAECYAFGPVELDAIAAELGEDVRATTSAGKPALDLPAGVRRSLATVGVDDVFEIGGCTACAENFFSHRARADTGRHLLACWRPGEVA